MKTIINIYFCCLIGLSGYAQQKDVPVPTVQAGRTETDLSGYTWKIALDPDAKWQDDRLFIPGTSLDKIPVNLPTGGWEVLAKATGKETHLPATIEQYYWGANGNSFGLSGNYLGVSWFTTKVKVPSTLKGKRIVLNFESVRFRAEVFVNKKLVAYDLISGTPFDADITNAVDWGKDNEIAVRITDPNGNFDWRDSQNFMWGDYRTQPTHGFGGITGKVKLIATDQVFFSDLFVKNTPKVTTADLEISLQNNSGKALNGDLLLQVKDTRTGVMIWQKQAAENLDTGANVKTIIVAAADGKPWSVEDPNLYTVTATWKSQGSSDQINKRFGFRWFEIRDEKGDKQFYLNGKRIVLRTSISWGFWPVNGIAPSDALAKKQVQDAKALGLNMLNFHRTIGQTNVLDYADELGLLYFEEPGGNQIPENYFNPKNELEKKVAGFYLPARNEKFFRMVRRDRSHPSLVIYNMHNERGAQPNAIDKEEMLAGHKLDETRIMTYNSSNGAIKQDEPDPKFKLHLLPYGTTFYDYGWFDQHHAGGPGVYHNNLYSGVNKYAKYTDHKDEIYYLGEEGAIGTPPRLQLIRDEILKTGADIGWESSSYLKWYDAYDQFLKNNGFNKAFPNVDSLTRKMGNVAYYYQGRIIENIRMNNVIDGYAVNGWESMKLENHSGVVDNYRNLKGDASLIARYNTPLYLAVKINRKVLSTKDTATIDLYIVNEKDLKGEATVELQATNAAGKTVWTKSIPVKVTGGSTYGQLLTSGLKFNPQTSGYTKITASLKQHNKVVTTGEDDLYAVALNTANIPAGVAVADTSGVIGSFLKYAGIPAKDYRSGRPEGTVLVVGAFDPIQTGNPLVTDILEWVNNGNTLVIAGNAEKWAAHLARKEVIDYRGAQVLGTSWYGGNYFVKQHPLFDGLPQNCVFNWEYQCLAAYNKNRLGLRIGNGETIVGCVSDHKPEVYSALSIVSHGRGKIIISALDIMSCINDIKVEKKAEGDGENAALNTFNTSAKNPANIVGQQLLLNMIGFKPRINREL
jgi:beta-galactosidase